MTKESIKQFNEQQTNIKYQNFKQSNLYMTNMFRQKRNNLITK